MSAGVRLAGVIGWPVAQSLSPRLHGHWIAKHGIEGSYVALPVRAEDFGRVADALPRMGFAGANVTVPHKEAAFALCSALDDDARATGAVNTLVFENGEVRGLNTDGMGFAVSLAESLGADIARQGPVAVLGAGGAARGILNVLLKAGAPEIRILNRTRKRAEQLAAVFASPGLRVENWGAWDAAFAGANLLINTTSFGMKGKDPLEVPLDALPSAAAVADIVYNPLETALLRAARARGLRTMDGLGMLMHQAVPAFAAWFGITPEVTPQLRAELVKALAGG